MKLNIQDMPIYIYTQFCIEVKFILNSCNMKKRLLSS